MLPRYFEYLITQFWSFYEIFLLAMQNPVKKGFYFLFFFKLLLGRIQSWVKCVLRM